MSRICVCVKFVIGERTNGIMMQMYDCCRNGLDRRGDRPHESLIFQCFSGSVPALATIWPLSPAFPTVGGPETNSYSVHFSFAEMWYDASVDAGSVGRIAGSVGSVPAMLIVNVIGNLPRFVRWQ